MQSRSSEKVIDRFDKNGDGELGKAEHKNLHQTRHARPHAEGTCKKHNGEGGNGKGKGKYPVSYQE